MCGHGDRTDRCAGRRGRKVRGGRRVGVGGRAVGNQHHDRAVRFGELAGVGHRDLELIGTGSAVKLHRAVGRCCCAIGREGDRTRAEHLFPGVNAVALCVVVSSRPQDRGSRRQIEDRVIDRGQLHGLECSQGKRVDVGGDHIECRPSRAGVRDQVGLEEADNIGVRFDRVHARAEAAEQLDCRITPNILDHLHAGLHAIGDVIHRHGLNPSRAHTTREHLIRRRTNHDRVEDRPGQGPDVVVGEIGVGRPERAAGLT